MVLYAVAGSNKTRNIKKELFLCIEQGGRREEYSIVSYQYHDSTWLVPPKRFGANNLFPESRGETKNQRYHTNYKLYQRSIVKVFLRSHRISCLSFPSEHG